MQYEFYKENDTDKVWWVRTPKIGLFLFSFDKKKVYNLYQDYPHALSKDEKAVFDAENPYWVEYFSDRWLSSPTFLVFFVLYIPLDA